MQEEKSVAPRFRRLAILAPILFSVFAVAQATHVDSFTISGSPVGNSSQFATGTVSVVRAPNDPGGVGINLPYTVVSGPSASVTLVCDDGAITGGCFLPTGKTSTGFKAYGAEINAAEHVTFNASVESTCVL
jgi:hypothetical protein